MKDYHCDLLISGQGPVGLLAAHTLSSAGIKTLLLGAPAKAMTEAAPLILSVRSKILLERLGLWKKLLVHSQALQRIHISASGLFGATRINCRDHRLPALGYVIAVQPLLDILQESLPQHVQRCAASITSAQCDRQKAQIQLSDGQHLSARLLLVAEGAHSASGRQISNSSHHDYQQIAWVFRAHGQTLGPIAYERFTAEGPLALLPHRDGATLIHICRADREAEIRALSNLQWQRWIQQMALPWLRPMRLERPSHCHPLALHWAHKQIGPRWILLGNTARTLHPVAGQGLNLALRDLLALRRLLAPLLAQGQDPEHNHEWKTAFLRQRLADQWISTAWTHGLVKLFSAQRPWPALLRSSILVGCDSLPPLRHWIGRRGMGLCA